MIDEIRLCTHVWSGTKPPCARQQYHFAFVAIYTLIGVPLFGWSIAAIGGIFTGMSAATAAPAAAPAAAPPHPSLRPPLFSWPRMCAITPNLPHYGVTITAKCVHTMVGILSII